MEVRALELFIRPLTPDSHVLLLPCFCVPLPGTLFQDRNSFSAKASSSTPMMRSNQWP